MATFSQLPSGKWRAQIRRAGIYRGATFESKAEARRWASIVEAQTHMAATTGYAPPPVEASVADLIDRYNKEDAAKRFGKTKLATLAMLRRELGEVPLRKLSPVHLRDFVDRRLRQGAGGVTIAADLSFLSAVLKWGRHARRLDIPAGIALEARADLKHRGIDTRSTERTREPTDDELVQLYEHWRANSRQRIPMETLVRFALASGMRLGEIVRIEGADVDRERHTVVIRDRKDPRRKAGNDQRVPLLPAAWEIVAPLLDERGDGFLFPFNADSVSTAFSRGCEAVGIHDLHFHDLRHRATAEFFRMGLSIPQVAIITGHRTWGMLRRYTDVKPEDVFSALAARAEPTRPKKPPAKDKAAKRDGAGDAR